MSNSKDIIVKSKRRRYWFSVVTTSFWYDNDVTIRSCPLSAVASAPQTVFRSISKFHQNLQCSGLKFTEPITTTFRTRHDSITIATCVKFSCDRLNMLWARAVQMSLNFEFDHNIVWNGRWWINLWTIAAPPSVDGSNSRQYAWLISRVRDVTFVKDTFATNSRIPLLLTLKSQEYQTNNHFKVFIGFRWYMYSGAGHFPKF